MVKAQKLFSILLLVSFVSCLNFTIFAQETESGQEGAQGEEQKERIEERREERIEAREENKEERLRKTRARFRARLVFLYKRMRVRVERRLNRLEEISTLAGSLADKMANQGEGVSTAREQLAQADEKIQQARSFFNQADETAKQIADSEDAKETAQEIRSLLSQSYNKMARSRVNIAKAIQSLKMAAKNGETSEEESATSVEPQTTK